MKRSQISEVMRHLALLKCGKKRCGGKGHRRHTGYCGSSTGQKKGTICPCFAIGTIR